jgi:hypothetical protein
MLFNSSLLSQSAITIYSGVNYPSRSFSVSPVVEYSHYQFNTYDKSKVVLTDDVKSSAGENSHIARFMIEAKLIDHAQDTADVYVSMCLQC